LRVAAVGFYLAEGGHKSAPTLRIRCGIWGIGEECL
jgi:hypothetical protein